MEKINERKQSLLKALKSLKESLALYKNPPLPSLYDEMRDSVIKRFEYSIDLFWKCSKEYLENNQKLIVEVASPKATFRTALNAKLISEEEFKILLKMVDDRNLTSHTYKENLAEEISKRIPAYYELMNELTQRFK